MFGTSCKLKVAGCMLQVEPSLVPLAEYLARIGIKYQPKLK